MSCCMMSLVCTIRNLFCLHAVASQKMSCPAFRLALIRSAVLITALTSQLFWYDAAIAFSTSLLHFGTGCLHPIMPCCLQEFLSLQDLDRFLADRLFTVVSQGQDRVTFDQLVIAKANCLKVLPITRPPCIICMPTPATWYTSCPYHLACKRCQCFRQLVMKQHPSASTFWTQAGAAW